MAGLEKRIKRTQLVQGGRFVVAVEVEMVIPPDDASEPCYEPETIKLLREIAEHAAQGDRDWIEKHGEVYERAPVDSNESENPILSQTDILLEKMFFARRIALITGVGLLGLVILIILTNALNLDRALILIKMCLPMFSTIFLLTIVVCTSITSYYMYLVAKLEVGYKYAFGHLLLCICLAPMVLIGPMMIPLQVYHDIERWRQDSGVPLRINRP